MSEAEAAPEPRGSGFESGGAALSTLIRCVEEKTGAVAPNERTALFTVLREGGVCRKDSADSVRQLREEGRLEAAEDCDEKSRRSVVFRV